MEKNKLSGEEYKKRFKPMEEDIRGSFFRDQTAIIHSLSFRKLKRKTQVFFASDNDNVCTRIEHVFHVFTNATTIAKGLNQKGWDLNVEMIQAIALGHDIGHAPFGHTGEEVLTDIFKKEFSHEINSLRVVDYLEGAGNGLNLTFGVRDGIVSHCGEKVEEEQFINPDFNVVRLEDIKESGKYPASYEGCIVRVADKISSLGRDIEDARSLKIIKKVPEDILGYTGIKDPDVRYRFNSAFLKKIIPDIVEVTNREGQIGFSDEGFEFVKKISAFSTKEIYNATEINRYKHYVGRILFNIYSSLSELFDKYGFDVYSCGYNFIKSYKSFGGYLKAHEKFYENSNADKNRILMDYISGMSDNYALRFAADISIPKSVFK